MRTAFLAAVLAAFFTPALAHSPLQTSDPENRATLTTAPDKITLEFRGNIRLTRVRVTNAGMDAVDLDLGNVSGFVSGYSLPMTSNGAGAYEVEWRGLGEDGHPMKGIVNFTVNPE